MATKLENDNCPSPTNDESDGEEEQDSVDSIEQEQGENKPNVADILKRLQSSGALIKKSKQEYRCITCDEDFPDWEELENHLIQHVSLPSVVLHKLPSDDEDAPPSGDENWSDEDEAEEPPKSLQKTPPKIDISQILKKTGISIKKPGETENQQKNADSVLNKLSGVRYTIKKNSTPIKKEPDDSKANDLMQKLEKLGAIKLKLKSDGNNTNSFKVINGLKDFKASDDEDEGSGNEDSKDDPDDFDEEHEKLGERDDSAENDSGDEQADPKKPQNNNVNLPMVNKKLTNTLKSLQGICIKTEQKTPTKQIISKTPGNEMPHQIKPSDISQLSKPPGRPAVKQTPKRANLPVAGKEIHQQTKETPQPNKLSHHPVETTGQERRQSQNIERRQSETLNIENIVVKKEKEDNVEEISTNSILLSNQIKSERASPPPSETISTPAIATIKSEPDAPPLSTTSKNPILSADNTGPTIPLLPVTKKEDSMTIIEINGDSNDEDDDCCVVSATPAPVVPKVEPIMPKTENISVSYPPPSYTTLSSRLTAPSTEKQHSFNWNAPDSKSIDMLDKTTDEIFESLLSTSTKKESLSLSDASEYISLDTLGPQHTCDVCNTRFTDLSLLEEHKMITGHSKSLVVPSSSSTLLPYNPSSNILSSLLPVKQLAEQVGKLSGMGGSGPGFTHQQNVMINIQAYPGAGGMMPPPQTYNAYPSGQNMSPGYPQPPNNMYNTQGQSMPGMHMNSGQPYMGQQGYGQFQTPMSKAGYPGAVPQNSYSTTSPYSTASPLQSMQQAVYGQSPTNMMNSQNQMPPPSSPYVPVSSPGGTMKPPSGIKIQNVQTFPPGQMTGVAGQTVADMTGTQVTAPGQVVGGQMPSPSQIRMAAGANITGVRPRMPNVRGQRPTIRPGIQVHGQIRVAKPGGPRMPLKRPAGMAGGPGQKRRPDMLLPGKHDNEDCQVMAMQKQREGLPMIQSVQGAKDKLNLGSQISITKKTVNKEANAMANVLASRGICVKQKQKSRSPSPERPVPHIPNLGAGVSIKHTSKSSSFSIPESKVGGGMLSCKICKKMFMNHNSLSVHMTNAHPQSKVPVFKCDECPASYPKSLQLQHHKRVFHNVSGPNRELGLPVVDLSQEENLKKLSNLGIYSFIPLANREQASGCFGIPVISVHNIHNGMTTGLQALGADGLLSLGPLKPLPNP